MSTAPQDLEAALAEITRTKETLALRLHLLSREARQVLAELEDRAAALEGEARAEGERALDRTAGKAREIAKALREFVERHAG